MNQIQKLNISMGVSILCLSQDEAGTPRWNDSLLEIIVEMVSLIGNDLSNIFLFHRKIITGQVKIIKCCILKRREIGSNK